MDRRIVPAALVAAVIGLAVMAWQAAELPGNSVSLFAVLLTSVPLLIVSVNRMLKRK